ncbi:PAS domain-containing sensor histidine kinase [uncultured Sphingomonas sp.]|uniref:sensor histidine kinase n=1 Tax=uncultured Sphingomonas sp. TaxID=158754 RepID=UPI0025E4C2B6|nr:PAS domain-containing sensor histidine kinase [uncultured Sphingomonas sp.]
MIANLPTGTLLLATMGGLWLVLAVAATLVGVRKAARAESSIAEARAVADLLAGAPSLPMLVYPDDAIDADPRIASWLELDAVPTRLTDFAKEPRLAEGDYAALVDAIRATRASSRQVQITIGQAPGRIFSLRVEPYSVAGDDRRVVLVWLLDVSETQRAIGRLDQQVVRMRRAVDGLSALIEAAPFPMWHRGPNMDLALVNGAYVRAVEAGDAEQVVAQGIELVETGGGQTPSASAAEARDRRHVVIRSAPAIIAGQRRMMRVADVPIGESGVAGYAMDIQELEDARSDLGLFVRAQHDMFDRLSAGVAQFAADHSLVFYNRQFVRLFALEPDWLSDHPEFDRVLERMREAQRAPESRDFPGWKAERRQWFALAQPAEENWLLPGGTHIRVVAQPLPDRGLLLIFEDRTEHLQLASARDTLVRVRTATFDSLFEAIGVFAADGRLNLWNTRFRDVWDLPEEELARHPRVDALVQTIAPKLLDPSRAGLIRDLVRIATVERQHRSGRISLVDGRHFEFAAVPLPDGNALFTLLDVTASRGIEEALRDRNEALEEANRLKNSFVASMSYELRVPLTSIAGFAEMLGSGYAGELSATARDYVEAILSGVQRLSSLTSDVLDLTQSAAGTLPMAMESLAVSELVRGAVDLVRDSAHNSGLLLAADIAPESGTVVGDRKRLMQTFDHLLRNAVSYTPAGGRVLVRSKRVDGAAEIVISDNGQGIAPKQRERLFDRMTRSTIGQDQGRSDEPGGGFGLPLARQLVEAHGGTLELLSEVGRGTSVIVRLPLDVADEEA